MDKETLCQHSPLDLAQALLTSEPIIYRENGNRTQNASKLIPKIQKLLPRLGITRVADISHLSPIAFPVFQGTRPSVYFHPEMGLNTGHQGKGKTKKQALISCMMEGLEGFCMEPRSANLIRSSYSFLSQSHFTVDPSGFQKNLNKNSFSKRAPLMWTEVYSLKDKKSVLIPAELVYFPFNPESYDTRSIFVQSTNGVAAGATYLEAVTHSIYEVIERQYIKYLLDNKAIVFKLETPDSERLKRVFKGMDSHSEMALNFYLIYNKKFSKNNLPMVIAHAQYENIHGLGYGLSSQLSLSTHRAASEVLQSFTTLLSGAREDLLKSKVRNSFDYSRAILQFILLGSTSLLRKKHSSLYSEQVFKNLKNEFDFQIQWLKKRGWPDVYFANLTRVGVDVPVVKTIIPYMESYLRREHPWSATDPERFRYQGFIK